MSTSSFSSFPLSFSTFPELEPGTSSRKSDPEVPRERDKRSKSKDNLESKKEGRDRNRGKRKDRDRSRERERKKEKEKFRERSRDRYSERETDRKLERDRESKFRHKHRDHENDKRRSKPPSFDEPEREGSFVTDLKKHEDSYRLYFTDAKGDPLTLQYGGLYAGDIPRYHLHRGGRQILGLSKAWTVFRRAGRGIEVGLRGTHKLVGLSDSGARSLLALPATKLLLPSTASSSKYEEVDGVIRLPSRRGRKEPEDSYRSIELSRGVDSDSESSISSAAESDSEDGKSNSPELTSHQVAIKNLEQDLAEDPTAIDKWLSLLNHTLSTIPITSRNATKARSEITVSVLSRALSASPGNSSSKLLRLRYMKAGEELWQETKLKAEWEETLRVGGIEIWLEWFEWRIRSYAKSLDRIAEDVSRVCAALGGNSDEAQELARLRVFWRLAEIYRNAGFTEKAMAMFQAQAELSFKAPQTLANASLDVCLPELEEFWDSEAPRMGEEDARGWGEWYASGKPETVAMRGTALTEQDTEQVAQLDPYRQWAFREVQQDRSSLLPAKSFEEAAESDPYTTVLFSDIRSFLFEIKYPSTRDGLRLAWLSFLGLHVPGFPTSLSNDHGLNWDDRWSMGYLTTRPHLNAIFPTESSKKAITTDSAAGTLVGREKEYAESFKIPVREWGKGVVGCLDIAVNGSKGLRSWWNEEDIAGVDVPVVRRVFAQLRTGSRDVEWDSMALAFESAVNLKDSLKLSKSLVSTVQGSLLHWAAHAQLVRMRGRLDDARKVYQTVLIASKPTRTATGISILWWNWAELEWLAGNDDQTINIILRSVDLENVSSGVVLLRAKRALEDRAEVLVSSIGEEITMKEREAWVKLRALLEILTGKDVASMFRIFDRYLRPKDCPDVARESLLVASLVMLYRYGYVLKNPMPPTILRDRVSEVLEAYPGNSIVLGIFLEGEKGQGVWGRVRGMLGDNEMKVGKTKDVARRVEEVWIAGWEKARWESEVERTRSGLAAAVESERTRASPVIWRIYLEFEIRVGDLQRAKKILYRAIGECPFYKDLYLLAFGVLRSVFTAHELNSLGDVMAEKGLRLRTGLDEVLEGWDMDVTEERDEGSEEGGESEIEERAKELRRLMPY